jgi:hypothetical protein
MKTLLRATVVSVVVLAGCVGTSTTVSSKHPGLVGTWKWISMDQEIVKSPFYIRYYPDGAAATWPAPRGWSDTNGVSRGRYHLEGQFLVLETGQGKDDPRTRMKVTGDELVLVSNESNRLVYHRVVPDLEPGGLGFAPED